MARFDWRALRHDLRYGLLLGATGKPHLVRLARLALAQPAGPRADAPSAADKDSQRPDVTLQAVVGLWLLRAAFDASPLDGALAASLAGLQGHGLRSGEPLAGIARAVAASWRAPADTGPLAELAARRAHAELMAWLVKRMRAEPGNLFWRQHVLDLAYLLADWDQAALAAELPWPSGLKAAAHKVAGDIAFQTGDYAAAAARYALASPLARQRRAEALRRSGEVVAAQALWRALAAEAPWDVNTVLKLHDSLAGLDRADQKPPEGALVCLYTSGKADELAATLAALAASELGAARILALDNASCDHTPQVLAAWKERLGPRLDTLRLPVNIGAPAARNWLLTHQAARTSRFIAYLDDDAVVPLDWMLRMHTAIKAYPQAGVWGARIADLAAPGRLQHADIHLEAEDGPVPAFASLCSQDLDFGQFDYLRPCLSVTGCCHVFRTATLFDNGGFDIRFSPTQYDDLDHDLRLVSASRPPVYQGHLRVLHARLSGALLGQDRRGTANSQGNLKKLSGKHPPAALALLRQADHQAMLDDLLQKTRSAGLRQTDPDRDLA